MSALFDIIIGFIATLVSAAFLHFGAGGAAPAPKPEAPAQPTEVIVPAETEVTEAARIAEADARQAYAEMERQKAVRVQVVEKVAAQAPKMDQAPKAAPKPAPHTHFIAPPAPPAAPKPPVMHFSLISDQDMRSEMERRLEADIERQMVLHQQRMAHEVERAVQVQLKKAHRIESSVKVTGVIVVKAPVEVQVAANPEPVSGPDCPQTDEGRDRPQNIRTFTGH